MPMARLSAGASIAAEEQQRWGIVNLAEHPRVGGIVAGDDGDTLLSAKLDFCGDVDFGGAALYFAAQLGADPRHAAQVARRGREHLFCRAEPFDQPTVEQRANARHQGQA